MKKKRSIVTGLLAVLATEFIPFWYGTFDYALLYANDMEPKECPNCKGSYLYVVEGHPNDVACRMAKKRYVTLGGCQKPFAGNTRKCIDCGYPVKEPKKRECADDIWREINTIVAHNERDTIVGNFTGNGIDTLFVEAVASTSENADYPVTFYLSSTNLNIPQIELYGCTEAPPKLVNEGDLDGNGTCEVGYLHTWTTSQWRYYRIFTLVGNEWRNLVDGDYLDTPEWFRNSGVEIAEPGEQSGIILIHYAYDGYDEAVDSIVKVVRDTIVAPTFSFID